MSAPPPVRLAALLGDYPVTAALKQGRLRSPRLALDFAAVGTPNTAFKRVVRELEFDVAELALMTFLMAKAQGRPLALLPAVLVGRFQHPYLVYAAARGPLAPQALAGRRVGIRAYSVTTATWIRCLLAEDYGVDVARIRWVTFEEAHVAGFRDPPNAERAPQGKALVAMLLDGELDAAVVGEAALADARLRPVIPDPQAAARAWQRRHGALQINHMVVVREALSQAAPEVVREVYRLLLESRRAAGPQAAGEPDPNPFGIEANRRNLEIAIDCAWRQKLIARRLEVDELFDDVTRTLGG